MTNISLRTRLIALLVVISAVGLVTLGSITYVSQRSSETRRLDEQTATAERAVDHALDEQGVSGTKTGGSDKGSGGPLGDQGPVDTFTNDADLPAGTYGQRRAQDGRTIEGHAVIDYGKTQPSAPRLPTVIRAGQLGTVRSVDGRLEYRFRVASAPDGLLVVAVPTTAADHAVRGLLEEQALVIGVVLLLLGGITTLLVRVEFRPLNAIADTADAIAAGDLDRRVRVTGPRTEVGRLGVALNGMLARLENAFAETKASEERLRRFLSDAAHELRTPLVSIRGYAELFRMGATPDEARTKTAMRRIEDESARMGTLVEDLLVLARLDEIRTVEQTVVDVAALVDDAALDAEAISPDRAVTVSVDGEALVLGDNNALRQVLANLISNAVAHTPAGTPIELGCRFDDEQVYLSVRDHGGGLPTDRPDDLFERFWRVGQDRGRARGKAGSGLGLSIVAAIARAHHGHAAAANADGGGAVFTITLPRYVGTPDAVAGTPT